MAATKGHYDIDISAKVSVAEWLRGLSCATEVELLPFVTPRSQKQSSFRYVSRVWGNHFRIWKIPGSTRLNRKWCFPYLQGFVTAVDDGCRVQGSFSLHPLTWIVLAVPFVIFAIPVILGPPTVLLFGLSAIPLAMFIAALTDLVRRRRQYCAEDEEEMALFLSTVPPVLDAASKPGQ